MSFLLDFPDDEIVDILGDTVSLEDDVGGSTTMKVVFEHRVIYDAVADLEVQHPVIVVNDEEKDLFKTGYRVGFNGKFYKILRGLPDEKENGKYVFTMRSDYDN